MEYKIDGHGASFVMLADTEYEEHRAKTLFEKEPETIDWIKTFFKAGDTFFDIGANVGVYTFFAQAFFKGEVETYAFEPVYHNYAKLCKNVLANKAGASVFPYNVALDDKTGFSHISVISDISGSANHTVGKEHKEGEVLHQPIFSVTLDELVFTHNFPVPQHVKIDVDGTEEEVVVGALKTFADPKLSSVLVEVTNEGGASERIRTQMKEAGLTDELPINTQENHSRVRREASGNGQIENIIFGRV